MIRTLLVLALLPLAVHAQSANVVAGLQDDVSSLRDEVRKLRLEVEELREAKAAAPARADTTSASDLNAVNARIAAVDSAQTAARRDDKAAILSEVDRKVENLAARVNRALTDQTRQVNNALKSGRAAGPADTGVAPVAPRAETKPAELSGDMPKNGVRYTVQPGDSLSRISRKMNSKPAWILAANNLKSNADLKAYAVIFVPQPDATPAPAAKE